MTIPGSTNPLLLNSVSTQYQVSKSLRFNSSDSAYCSRTPSTAGNRKTWTWAGWVKRSALGSGFLFARSTDLYFGFAADVFTFISTSVGNVGSDTLAIFRDVSAWYHIVVAFDTTQATASDRLKIYVNSVLQTTTTRAGYSTNYPPSPNVDYAVNAAASHSIGSIDASNYFSGYLADIHFIDGQALTPSSFTEVSATTGKLLPRQYTGSFGTNGFRLDFSNPLDLGNDAAGTNDWTPNNLSGVSGGPTSVAAASGALPIYNTTDTYGATKGTGARTDSNSSSIVLALPMDGSNNGTTFTDESATIKGSGSPKSITRFSTVTSSARSKYYGSSGYFNGASSSLGVSSSVDFSFGTGNFTVECWVYLNSHGGGTYNHYFSIQAQNTFAIKSYINGVYLYANSGTAVITSSGPSLNKWTHLALVRNGSVLTIYIDGIASGSASTSASFGANAAATVGVATGADGEYLDGYMQDLRVYKGAAKYTSNFNPPSSTQNATVAAGNDSLVDTPTSYGTDTGAGGEVRGNYCTLNPLTGGGGTLSNGNLDYTVSAGTYTSGTIRVNSNSWYYEFTITAAGGSGRWWGGFIDESQGDSFGYATKSLMYANDGSNGNNVVSGAAYTTGDVIGVSLNASTGSATFYKNGVSQFTMNSGLSGATWRPVVGSGGATWTCVVNFGQRPFAYTAPSGFKALCDTNLPAPTVIKPSTVMDVKLYTGNGGTQTISGLGFSPDLVWIKQRDTARDNQLQDTVRGVGKELQSNATNSEQSYGLVSSFNSDGFTVFTNGTYLASNQSGGSYAAWCWDAGTTTTTINANAYSAGVPSITSSVRANASAGFSVATLTTPSSGNFTVGHGLNIAPSLVICKARNQAFTWLVYHKSAGAGNYLVLNTTAASTASSTIWQNTDPSSTLVYGNASNWGTADYVMYSFAPVNSYSAFGSYQGNGSADGPFVYCGFRPRWVMWKSATSASTSWVIIDAARDTYNISQNYLLANAADAQASAGLLDLTANGFKIRGTQTGTNVNGETIIYAAFAENPFQYARAR